MSIKLVLVFFTLGVLCVQFALSQQHKLLVVTIATSENDGFRQFLYSTKKYGIATEVFGMGEKWNGGDLTYGTGGGQKVNILKKGLEKHQHDDELIILFSDSYDAVITGTEAEILEKYRAIKAGVVFSAEGFCWPDTSLAELYPKVGSNEKRFLNSGDDALTFRRKKPAARDWWSAITISWSEEEVRDTTKRHLSFMGKAKDIYAIVSHKQITNKDDDQLYYTNIFLDKVLRKKWDIKLDTKSEIFQALNGALDDVEVKFLGTTSYLYNHVAGTRPLVIHGNGPIKPEFYRLSNYLMDGWTTTHGCQRCKEDTISLAHLKTQIIWWTGGRQRCKEDTISLADLKEADYPEVLLAIFLEKSTPFVRELFENLAALVYPKHRVDVLIHNADEFHTDDVKTFVSAQSPYYRSMGVIEPELRLTEITAKNRAIDECVRKSCKYLFAVDSISHLTNENALVSLIEQNRSVLAPLLMRPEKLWSNFWGNLGSDGFYARSKDYIDIVELTNIGVWNVPHVSQALLIHGSVLPHIVNGFTNGNLDADMAICKTLREKGIFIYLSNREHFGHLIDNDNYQTTHMHNEMYEIFSNPYNWEKRYIHPDFYEITKPDTKIPEPCTDVFSLHIFTPEFCWDLIDEMENFGDWSGSSHEDKRLSAGYENVPTDDIHMNQIGYDQHWLQVLQKYVTPLQQKVFTGYYHDPPVSIMNFVVRYKPSAQPYLRPHHDSSTFSINVALNRYGQDFQGGGTHFIRQNCSVLDNPQGWVIIHPGKLTHYHEGLKTTGGTRYIMISFVDP